ncbi:glutamate--tRNA ligase-like isoform X2 [Pecten maximus]|uniref:glutamate--tRNA ligase-like isoform X2 n=1 Tax=Pecten maximus TaxID=6579 RepID=UPI0014583F72|nr:glutamate--tRNA ligase-like isoform X2 [Pecten maximus]
MLDDIMNGRTRITENVCHFGVFFTACTLLASNYLEAASSYVYYSDQMNWYEAKAKCAAYGQILVKIDTQDVFDELRMMDADFNGAISGGEFWTGLHTSTDTCIDFKWDDGVTASWLRWDSNAGDPNNCNTEKCVRLFQSRMRTKACTATYPFMCQAVEETTTVPSTEAPSTESLGEPTTASTTNSPTETEANTVSTTNSPTTETETTAVPSTEIPSTEVKETTTVSTTGSPTETEITTVSTTGSPTETEITTVSTTGSPTETEITTVSTTGSPTETEITTVPSTEIPSTEDKETQTMLTDESTTITSGVVGGTGYTSSGLVETEVSTPGGLGYGNCLCDGNPLNNSYRLRGIIPSSTAHKNSLMMAGYVRSCSARIYWGNGTLSLSHEEKLALLNALKDQLNVAKDTTSLYRRARISAPDDRPSAVSVGSLGICLLVGFAVTVLATDATTLYRYWKNLKRNVN